MSRRAAVKSEFEQIFGAAPEHVFRAPGRVNLIGEHTDYNQGFVLPMAIDRELLIAARPRQDGEVRMVALDVDRQADGFAVDGSEQRSEYRWANYVRGVVYQLKQKGLDLKGMDAVLTSEIPAGAGLSSSAALEVCTAVAFETFSGQTLDLVRTARLCQRAENEFVGVKSGIMDQFASALGREGHALLIDCRALSVQYVPLPPGVVIVVADTMKKHSHASSEYNHRRAECEEAVRLLSQLLGRALTSLRDVSTEEFLGVESKLGEVPRKRARHIITENARVLEATAAAERGDVGELGRLMNQSHESMRYDFQISCEEVDAMVEIARRQAGCYGARLTGGGFGGSTVNLVREQEAEAFMKRLAGGYAERIGLKPNVMVVRASAGVTVVE